MRKKNNHFLLELIDIVKQELLAVLAVAGVLTFVFNQATASHLVAMDPETEIVTANIPAVTTTNIEADGATLFAGSTTIYFGSQIQGFNNLVETWTNTNSIANLGIGLIAESPVQVTITGVNNGTFPIYATASGDFTLNGTKFSLGEKLGIDRGTVTVSNNKLNVAFSAEAKIVKLSTEGGDMEIANNQTPTILSIVPEIKSMYPGTTLEPVTIALDETGSIMSSQIIEWSSSDTSTATVDSQGKIKALRPGVVTVTATVAGTDITTSISINIPNARVDLPPVVRLNTKLEQKVSDLVSDIKDNTDTTPNNSTNIDKSLMQYLFGETTSAASPNIALEQVGSANVPLVQRAVDYLIKLFSFIGR